MRAAYCRLQQEFISLSYGYYTESFIAHISESACAKRPQLMALPLRKMLREVVKKYMLNDLELIFVGHFAEVHRWDIEHESIERHCGVWSN